MNQPKPGVFFNEADQAIAAQVNTLLQTQERVLLAIDGNCCAGKTTTASRLGALLGANVFHLDDYFLQPHMRTPERLRQPGGNVDAERFLADVLLPVSRGEMALVRRYDCHRDELLAPEAVMPRRVSIIEGAYCMHPLLVRSYDIKIFCRIDPALQRERILARNGEKMLPMFLTRWVPLENAYFSAFPIEQRCDFIIESTQR
ncbi:MAG: uridine kinase [Christensenella sp.]|nr:uridine kinase [Christensenella sp.]